MIIASEWASEWAIEEPEIGCVCLLKHSHWMKWNEATLNCSVATHKPNGIQFSASHSMLEYRIQNKLNKSRIENHGWTISSWVSRFCLVLDLTETSRIQQRIMYVHYTVIPCYTSIAISIYIYILYEEENKTLFNFMDKIVSLTCKDLTSNTLNVTHSLWHYDQEHFCFYRVFRFRAISAVQPERNGENTQTKNNDKTETTHKNKYRMNSFVKSVRCTCSLSHTLTHTHIHSNEYMPIFAARRIHTDKQANSQASRQTDRQSERARTNLFEAHTPRLPYTTIYGKTWRQTRTKLN